MQQIKIYGKFFFCITLAKDDKINHFNSSNLNGLKVGVGHFLLLPIRMRKVEEIKYKFPFVALKKISTVHILYIGTYTS